MSSDRSTEGLIRELAEGLEPVRRLPRLRVAVIATVAAWVLATLGIQLWAGASLRTHWDGVAFLAVMLGLSITAIAALVASLAGSVPGRAKLALGARRTALGGGLLALGAAGLALVAAAGHSPSMPLEAHLQCAGRACVLGIVPALLASAFLARAENHRPLLAAASAGIGALGLGALAVHASCGADAPLHWLIGHSLVPLGAALLLALPLALWLARRRAA